MKKLNALIIVFAIGILSGCGDSTKVDDGNMANFAADGFSVRIEQSSINTYLITVIENTRYPNAVFTVYGLSDESEFGSFLTSSKMRLAHVVNSSAEGQSFEVTFNDNDSWFGIYHDDWDGFNWIYSTGREMVRGQFR